MSTDTKWRGVLFRLWGNDVELTRELFPKTFQVLDDVPGVITAMHSILAPGKKIRIHPGVFKGSIRVHMPLYIPPGDAGISIMGKVCRWHEGEALIFDESYPHRAWNLTNEARSVMIVDIVRPLRWGWLDRVNSRVLGMVRSSPRVLRAVSKAEAYQPALHPAAPVEQW